MKSFADNLRPFLPLFHAFFLSSGFTTAQGEKPNILFIYTDDQSTRTVSCYPDAYPWVKTPNIDALAKEGILFSQAYNGSWCMPSRATMLTGHHQHNVQSMRMVGKYPGSTYDAEQCPFWPSVFRKAGYATAQIGKWHTGLDTGFGRDWDYQIVWNRPRYPENSVKYYYGQLIETNGSAPELFEKYSTDLYTDWAVDYITDMSLDQQKPWYLWLCYGAVHGPFTPADRHLDAYPDIPSPDIKDIYPPRPGKPKYASNMELWVPGKDGEPVLKKQDIADTLPARSLKDWIRQYHQGVLAIDEGVGRIIRALKETGQYDNTVIVFTSDQGYAWGQHGFKHKVAPYYATIASPLIFKMPVNISKTAKGKVVDKPVSGVDIPVTFFSLAGLELPWRMDGRDLSPLLLNPDSSWEHPAMMVNTGTSYGSDTDTIPGKNDSRLYWGPDVPWYVILAQGRYKYIRTLVEGETDELYDMVNDPNELHNLALDPLYQDILAQYRQAAINELKRTGARFVNHLPNLKKDTLESEAR